MFRHPPVRNPRKKTNTLRLPTSPHPRTHQQARAISRAHHITFLRIFLPARQFPRVSSRARSKLIKNATGPRWLAIVFPTPDGLDPFLERFLFLGTGRAVVPLQPAHFPR